jgi:hypothetical protein
LRYLVEGEPLRNLRSYTEENAETIEAALIATGITPPDLDVYLADIATFNTMVTAGQFDDTGWVDLTSTGYTETSDPAPRLRRLGHVVFAQGGWTNAGMVANTTYVVSTIPDGQGLRPSGTVQFTPGMSSAGSTGKIAVAANGQISVSTSGTVAGYFRLDPGQWIRA